MLTNGLFKTVAMTLVMSAGQQWALYGTFFLRFAGAAGQRSNLTPMLCTRHCALDSPASSAA